jgi:anti-sigma B factor antagonist
VPGIRVRHPLRVAIRGCEGGWASLWRRAYGQGCGPGRGAENGGNMNSQVARIHQQGDASVVEVHGEVDMHRSPELHQLLREVCQGRPAKLVVDLSRVEYMDSSGIGTLVEIFRRVKGFEGQMMLVALQPRVRGVFEITKLDKFFTIHDSVAEALQ